MAGQPGYGATPGFSSSYQALQGLGPYTQQPVHIPYQPVSSQVPSSLLPPGYFSPLKAGGGIPVPPPPNPFLSYLRSGVPYGYGSTLGYFTGVGGAGHGGGAGGVSGGGAAASSGGSSSGSAAGAS